MSALCSSSQYIIVFPLFLCTFFLKRCLLSCIQEMGKKVQTDCRNELISYRATTTINLIKSKKKLNIFDLTKSAFYSFLQIFVIKLWEVSDFMFSCLPSKQRRNLICLSIDQMFIEDLLLEGMKMIMWRSLFWSTIKGIDQQPTF